MSQTVHIPFETFPDASALPADEQDLLSAAMDAAAGAYVPYSHFHVGCALQLADGGLLTGNNQENPAFPSSLCAERTVLYYAGAQGHGKDIRKIAIRARSERKAVAVPVTPCGACRQVMLEYERLAGEDLIVLMQGEDGEILRIKGVGKSLLPFVFDIEF